MTREKLQTKTCWLANLEPSARGAKNTFLLNLDRGTRSFASMPSRPPHQTTEEPDSEEVENAGAKPRGLH